MTDGPAFFRAIEADPDDDTPRLVYADWLDETAAADSDRARAELIRVQCELLRDPPAGRRLALHGREQQIIAAHGGVWAAVCPLKLYHPTYIRGFLDPVCCDTGFPRHAAQLAELMPLFHVRLYLARIVMRSIAACPQLALVRRLTLVSNVLRNDVTAFAVSPNLGNLQHLDLSENKIGIRGATDLAAAELPSLRSLRLARNPIKDRGLAALVLADWPSLEHLDLMHCDLSRAGVTGLAQSELARRLTALQLSNNDHVWADAWVALAAAPLERLQRLDLSNTNVTDAVIESLAANPALANLRTLHLGASTMTERGARAILNSPHLRGLTRLRLPEGTLDAALRERFRAALGDGFNPR